MKGDPLDPKRLIHESYRIEEISAEQCRSIFFDWALSLPDGADTHAALGVLLQRYEADHSDHPMTQVLRDGLVQMHAPRRRGGWRSRRRDPSTSGSNLN